MTLAQFKKGKGKTMNEFQRELQDYTREFLAERPELLRIMSQAKWDLLYGPGQENDPDDSETPWPGWDTALKAISEGAEEFEFSWVDWENCYCLDQETGEGECHCDPFRVSGRDAIEALCGQSQAGRALAAMV